jgi:hypothetical protein
MKTINLLLCALCSLSVCASDAPSTPVPSTPLKDVTNTPSRARRGKKRRLELDAINNPDSKPDAATESVIDGVYYEDGDAIQDAFDKHPNPYHTFLLGGREWSALLYAVRFNSSFFPSVFAYFRVFDGKEDSMLWEDYIKAWHAFSCGKGECPSEHGATVFSPRDLKILKELLERHYDWAVLPAA